MCCFAIGSDGWRDVVAVSGVTGVCLPAPLSATLLLVTPPPNLPARSRLLMTTQRCGAGGGVPRDPQSHDRLSKVTADLMKSFETIITCSCRLVKEILSNSETRSSFDATVDFFDDRPDSVISE